MRQSYRGIFIVLFLSFVLGLAGCQQKGTAEKAGETLAEKVEKTGEYMEDSAITAKIKAEILSDPLLKVSQINVTNINGVVKLSGTVGSQQSIDRAMEIARSVKGVKSVKNDLVL